MFKKIAFILFITIAAGVFAQSSFTERLPDVAGIKPGFEPGAWVHYLVTDAEGMKTKVKFSVLSAEDCDGEECYWFEMKTTSSEGEWSIMKFKGVDPRDRESVISLIMQRQGEPARRMDMLLPSNRPQPPSAVSGGSKKDAEEPRDQVIKIEEKAKMEVPAGGFITTKYTISSGDEKSTAWISDEVPIMGLVAAESESGEIELVAYGEEGAESEIEGEVQTMDIPSRGRGMKKPAGK